MIGPALVAVAAWCAAGAITVAAPDESSHRLAALAPWWILPIAFALAALVPAWRRRPLVAAPALLSTLAWWPIPLPPIALIFTGPLAWLPIAVALGAAVGARPLAGIGRLVGASDCRRSMLLSALATAAICAAVAWNVDSHVPAGDEPHYLVITQSLLKDGDLRIENNHRQRDYAAYFGGDLAPHYVTRGRDAEIYSIHSPGTPVLVLPAFALFGYRGAEVWLLLLAGLTGSLLWRIGWRATGDPSAAWFAWAAVAGSASFLLHSFAVFPDAPGALAVAAGILLLVRLARTPGEVGARALVIVSALLGALPWLHTRFAVLAGGLGLLIAGSLLFDRSRPVAARRTRAAMFLVVPALSAAAWFVFFQWIYGTPNPAAPYGGAVGTRAAYIPGGIAGLLFDQQFGLLISAPVLALSLAGLTRVTERPLRRMAVATSVVALGYLAAVATYWLWWAGSPAAPARFAVAALPAATIPLAWLWRDGDAARRRMLLAVLAVSLGISAVVAGVDRGDLAWNMRNAEALWLEWLGPVVNLPRGWPSFFWKLNPAALATEVPFVVQAAAWIAIFVGGWRLLAALGRSRDWSPETGRLAVGCWMLAGLVAATQAGWWLNHVTGLDAARSQMTVLSADRGVWEIAGLHVRPVARLEGAMRVRTEEPGKTDGPPPWLALEWVPAGTYALHISSSRPRAGELAVTIGRSSAPVRTVSIKPLSRQMDTLILPAGAAWLTLTPSRDLDEVTGTIELEPQRLTGRHWFARSVTTYGSTRVFFLDDNAFVEPSGFWVRGGQSTGLLLEPSAGPADSPLTILLRNGENRNEVLLEAGSTQRFALGPSETKRISLSTTPGTPMPVRITSSSGFRPSDSGTSTDSRYLGVWLAFDQYLTAAPNHMP